MIIYLVLFNYHSSGAHNLTAIRLGREICIWFIQKAEQGFKPGSMLFESSKLGVIAWDYHVDGERWD